MERHVEEKAYALTILNNKAEVLFVDGYLTKMTKKEKSMLLLLGEWETVDIGGREIDAATVGGRWFIKCRDGKVRRVKEGATESPSPIPSETEYAKRFQFDFPTWTIT